MIIVDRYGNKFYGFPDWMDEEEGIQIKYMCEKYGGGYVDSLFGRIRGIMCVGMGGARVTYSHEVPCMTKDGRPVVINRDVVDESVLPLVCGHKTSSGLWDKRFVEKLDLLIKEVENIKCPGKHCVVLDKRVIMIGDLDTLLDWLVYMLDRRRITGYPIII